MEMIQFGNNKIKNDGILNEDCLTKQDIIKDLENIAIPEDVKQEANELFKRLKIRTRGKRRKKIIYYCIFFAYRKLNIIKEPKELCKLLGISNPNTNKDFFHKFYNLLDEKQKKEFKINEEVKPEDLLENTFEILSNSLNFNLNSFCLKEIEELLKHIRQTCIMIEEEFSPKLIAAGATFLYLCNNGVTMSIKEYSKLLDCSELLLNKFIKITTRSIFN